MNIKNLALIILAAVTAGGLAVAAETNTNAPSTNAPVASTNADASAPAVAQAPPATNAPDVAETNDTAGVTPTNAVRMDFHDVPLNTILNYLSLRMGFVINSETEVRGNATIVSEQPVNTNEVLQLLSSALAKNNYSVSLDGRILTIATAENAKTDSPVKTAASPDQVPINDAIATFILPVHTLNPTQLIKDLAELIPPGATLAANEAGNALIMTARQRDIHRFSEIINALDSSSVSDVRVFVLNYADAKAVAAELKEIFQSSDATATRSDSRRSRGGFGGFPGFGGDPGGGGGGSSGSDSKNAANKAVFVSDDQRNAVVASAPPDYFVLITNVISELDKPSQDITEMRVFKLKYADASEMADELSNLFPDDTKNNTDQNSRSFGFRFFNPTPTPTPASGTSDRMKRQATVRVVPDLRTASVVVTTSKDLMEQIKGVIETLDKDPAMVTHVTSFDIDNADPVTVQAALTALFSGPNTKTQPQSSSASALQQRATSAAQQQTQSSSGFGSAASGSSALH